MPSGVEVLEVEIISLHPGLQEPSSSEVTPLTWARTVVFLGVPHFCCSLPPPHQASTALCPTWADTQHPQPFSTVVTTVTTASMAHLQKARPEITYATCKTFWDICNSLSFHSMGELHLKYLPLLVRESLSSLVVNQAWLTADTSSLPIGEISSNCSFWRILKKPVWNDRVSYSVVCITLQLTWRHSLKEN